MESIAAFAEAAAVSIPNADVNGYEGADVSDILTLSAQGASFCSHTDSHLILASNDEETCFRSIEAAQHFFQKYRLDTSCLAYPIGKSHSIFRRRHIAEKAGYSLAFTTLEGIVRHTSDPLLIPRIPYPLSEKHLDAICSSLATFRFDQDNWLIKLHNLKSLKVLINEFGGKAAALNWLKHQTRLYIGQFKNYTNLNFNKINRVVFFCRGNINRSAVAETIFKLHSNFAHDSFGLITEKNFPPSIETQRWARKHDISILSHKTKRLEDFEFHKGDLLVAFEPEHLGHIQKHTQLSENLQYNL
jgi:predicted protein tyrosine phosphatase